MHNKIKNVWNKKTGFTVKNLCSSSKLELENELFFADAYSVLASSLKCFTTTRLQIIPSILSNALQHLG